MNKVPRTAYLKTKIVMIFITVFTVLAIAGYITYKNFDTLDQALTELSKPNEKLSLFTELLGEITSSENKIRTLVLNENKNLLSKYEKSIAPVYLTLDSLNKLVLADTFQSNQIREVSKLLKAKKGSFNAYIIQKRRTEQFDTYEEVLDKASENKGVETKSERKPTEFKKSIKPNIPKQNLSVPILFREYKKAIENYYKEYTRLQFSPENVVEMDKLESILSNVEFSQSSKLATMTDKELELLQNNTEITERIRGIIGDLEKAERDEIAKKQRQTREVIKKANNTLYTITIIAFCLIAIFTYLILSDITKSNFYRKQLIAAKFKAEQLSKVKQEFLANMSHEIRTPLNAIIGFSEQLSKSELDNKQNTQLQAVKHSSEHLLATVNDILDFSKIDAGKLKIEQIPFRLDEAILSVVNTLQIKADEKAIQLDTSLEKDFEQIVVLGDPFRLQQILLNLVNNAIKFTNEGFVEIEGEVLDKMGSTLQVIIRVNDTGIGIPKDKIDAVFKNFSQADTSTTRKYGGTGLGLSIVQKLVKLMDGKIKVESEVGKGASFIIELKFKKASLEQKVNHSITSINEAISFNKGKVLIVDDDHFNLMLCKTILQKINLEVEYASSGKDAMKRLKKQHFDLLITDIQMPDVSGLELAKFTRSLKYNNKEIPIIAFTANVMEKDLKEFSKYGINGHLLKPFKESELLKKISEHLPDSYSQATQNQEQTTPLLHTNNFYSINKIKAFTDDNENLKEIIEEFIVSSSADIEALQLAKNAIDKTLISELAHKLLNGFSNFEVKEGIALLKKLERQIENLQEDEVISAVNKLTFIHQKLLAELKSIIESSAVI